ncbi:MAG TPA: squalene--hopene cyclase [Pirellulales bacterium]|jgi:squalene-hopene/tetraprenyl-beta-curcumene cyclase|nr:squalene--hopene cyclase [Pirellulales bacterium]
MTFHRFLSLAGSFSCLCALLVGATTSSAEEPITLDNVSDPGPNRLDEPLAGRFSLERGVRFLDAAALTWQKERQCFTCHTNYAYLYARPLVSSDAPAHTAVRRFAEDLVEKRWPEKGPRWDAEVVATAAALAFNDAATTGKLHPLTRTALERMWTVQRDDGGWTWLKCGWPPMEHDDDYGAALAALAVSVAPDDYRSGEAARRAIERLKGYLKKNPPPTLHHQALLLWATSYGEPFLDSGEAEATVAKLLKLEREGGGWSLPTLGDWQRVDKTPQDESSDGYGTSFVVYALRRAGLESRHPAIERGIAWLKGHQRESGRWITRSLKEDSEHYISHCGTAFAVMALVECGAESN